jgi:hypothetical protein
MQAVDFPAAATREAAAACGVAWPDTEQSATDLAERLRRLAGELTDAIATAQAGNRRRVDLRAEYDRERSRANGPR